MINPLKGNEIFDSITDNLNEKVRNPFFSTFVIAWCIANWKIIYITIFISEGSLKSLNIQKIEYITQQYSFLSLKSGIWSLGKLIIFPSISVWFVFYILSIIDHKIFEKSINNRINKQIAEKKIKTKLLSEEENEISKETDVLLAKDKKTKVVRESINSEQKIWDDEYAQINASIGIFRGAMNQLQECIYGRHGWNDQNQIDPKNLSVLHANGLIYDPNENEGKISMTNKGVYFMRKFLNSNA